MTRRFCSPRMHLPSHSSTTQNDEFDQVNMDESWTASMCKEIDKIEATSATGPLPRKRQLSPTKNAPISTRVLAEKCKMEAEEEAAAMPLSLTTLMPSVSTPSTPLQTPAVPTPTLADSIPQLPSPLTSKPPSTSMPQRRSPFEPPNPFLHGNTMPFLSKFGAPASAGFLATPAPPLHAPQPPLPTPYHALPPQFFASTVPSFLQHLQFNHPSLKSETPSTNILPSPQIMPIPSTKKDDATPASLTVLPPTTSLLRTCGMTRNRTEPKGETIRLDIRYVLKDILKRNDLR
ncbi:hypothetical protein E1B28_013085 [Marasmius oreades]|uniref:Uncharacterized protein n=1 Tax=Marasmius oreades TaxID=181124 RepID=A0A9P7RNW1_9AGAR|nr:uncharacterized protein E1B28_013085 [Marasmius oreades]KAG7087104.1 hypothetical protein E1B28_013085 [Marasmius oreades]